MWSDCEISMLGRRKLQIGRVNRFEQFHGLVIFGCMAFLLDYLDMSETKKDVASSPVSTLFSLDPICFDVVKANEHLDSITACSDCEDFIDRIKEYIDNAKKTVGALDDIQKLRLISEIQCMALKASRKSIRTQKREFKEYIKELKRLNQNKFPTSPSPSKAKREESLSAMEDDSSADESSSEAATTKVTGPIDAQSARVVIANGTGDLTDTEGDDFTVIARKKKVASIVIVASQNTTGLLNTLSEHLGTSLEGRFENEKLRVFPKTIL
ncbi:hypothetical protein TNCV_2454491 [Trichonephila clavipes]|nr:hypothetical protein TNCV_2454491 [Trichonephila clavipes]